MEDYDCILHGKLLKSYQTVLFLLKMEFYLTGVRQNCKCAEPKFGGVRAEAWCKGDCVQHTVNTG